MKTMTHAAICPEKFSEYSSVYVIGLGAFSKESHTQAIHDIIEENGAGIKDLVTGKGAL